MNDSVVWGLQHRTIIFTCPRYAGRIFFYLSRAIYFARAQTIMSARVQPLRVRQLPSGSTVAVRFSLFSLVNFMDEKQTRNF